jgi:type II secretory ATPase GspE/PulE/Tfp pilus assembly ATPase PilB-like protein
MNPRAAHFGAKEIDLRTVQFTADLLACIPAELARRYRVLPILSLPEKLQVAIADPSDLETLHALQNVIQRDLELFVAESWQLDEFIGRLYGQTTPYE